MFRLFRHPSTYSLVILPVLLAGYADDPPRFGPRDDAREPEPSLIAEADRQHDFGVVVASSGRKLNHVYRLANTTSRELKIVDVINRKTCCGEILAEDVKLLPGAVTNIKVTLLVGGRFGDVVNEAEVVTAPPSEPSIVLRTSATAHPPFRVEEISPSREAVLAGTSGTRGAEYRVFAAGSPSEPPTDLDRVRLASTVQVDWVGRKQAAPSEDGLVVESRRLVALLDSAGGAGDRTAEIHFKDGAQVLLKHVVYWEVIPHLTASPKVTVIGSGRTRHAAIIHSHDRQPFKITRVECSTPGIRCRATAGGPALAQTVEIEIVPQPLRGRGVATVYTDHPAQEKVDLPFLVLD